MSDPIPDRLLDELRGIGDPEADDLVAALTAERDVDGLLAVLRDLIRIPDPDELARALEKHGIEAVLRERCAAFIRDTRQLPAWADPALIERGEALFREHTFLAFVCLGCASLPACYCWAFEARILATTGRLTSDVPRRIPETAQMVLDVMGVGGLRCDAAGVGPGVSAAQKIRLMHAAIRRSLSFGREQALSAESLESLARSDDWLATFVYAASAEEVSATRERGDINQEQLAATLMTFSYVILNGYRRLGVRLDDADERAYLHAWNVVGHLLGMDRRILEALSSYAAAQSLFDKLMQRNCRASDDGKALTRALLDYMRSNTRRVSPLWYALGADHFPRLVMSKLVHPATAEALALVPGLLGRIQRVPLWWGLRLLGWLKNFAALQRLAERLFMVLSRHMWDWRVESPLEVRAPPGVRRTQPELPRELARHWGLD